MSKKITSILLLTIAVAFILTGCKKEDKIEVGDMVYAQWWEGEGHSWEEAKVVAIEGDEVTIEWKDTWAKGDETQVAKHIRKVVKRLPLEAKKVKEGMTVLVEPPDYADLYKGTVTKIEGDRYTVDFKSGDVMITREVGIEALWKAPE
jgi:FKBP-type peptidyl-prolyl cis-trans isomerase 2